MTKLSLLFAIVALLLNQVSGRALKVPRQVATEFIILHNNDMHARFEQTNTDSGKCQPEDAKINKCYGGFARVAHLVRKYREDAKNGGLATLYLNAGDTYTGTPWFTIFKDNITAAFLNKLKPDAISLGNHELDENVEGLVPFLNEVDFPVVACNLDLRKTPQLTMTKHLRNSTVLQVNGVKIGVVGYLTPDTKTLTSPNDVEYKPEIEAINVEAARLKNSGINIIIALGHSGYQKDQEIAAGCPDVDIVIGGHTNTFLYNGVQPNKERIDGPYPTTIRQKSGKEVPVVQAYAYTKYLGRLHVQFDVDGNLINFDGTPILLDATIPREDDVLQLLEVYRPNITALEHAVVGHTKVFLEGRTEICRQRECNLGNLIADSMVFGRVLEDLGGQHWTDAPIALIGGGGIRSSIEKRSDGIILEADVLSVLPFNNDIFVTRISGKLIRNALERSATLRSGDSNGGFLQMSGIHATYDYRKPEGERVRDVEVRCSECDVPNYGPLDDAKQYNVVVQQFLLGGGDGHTMQEKNGVEPQRLMKNDRDLLIQYLKQRDFVYPEVEGRLHIIEKDPPKEGGKDGACAIYASSLTMALAALLVVKHLLL